uniref:Uncharacterized protein n=1 Tax=Arundo donax TaxID=35708 RepID=A0A0A8YGS5_ARUDO
MFRYNKDNATLYAENYHAQDLLSSARTEQSQRRNMVANQGSQASSIL